jgi:hypothetical protein
MWGWVENGHLEAFRSVGAALTFINDFSWTATDDLRRSGGPNHLNHRPESFWNLGTFAPTRPHRLG